MVAGRVADAITTPTKRGCQVTEVRLASVRGCDVSSGQLPPPDGPRRPTPPANRMLQGRGEATGVTCDKCKSTVSCGACVRSRYGLS